MKKKPQETKAQKGALKKFQQAGTAAAAAQVHKHGQSAAQRRASRRNLRVARKDVALRKAGKKPVAPKKPALSPYEVNCCAAEAIAASLRLAGGNPSSEDMLELYWRVASGPEDGADVEDLLRAAWLGFAGWYPEFRPGVAIGSVLVYQDWKDGEAHAVALHPAGALISWGEMIPFTLAPGEAWRVDWRRATM